MSLSRFSNRTSVSNLKGSRVENIEIKYRLADRKSFETALKQFEDIEFQYTQQQRDIYFDVPVGRLKIRIQDQLQPHLIRYQRADESVERISQYEIKYLDNVDQEIVRLTHEFGLVAEVVKQRTLYLFRNVRVHLDQVDLLGDFLEFESVISDSCDHDLAASNLQVLNQRLASFLLEPQAVGYVDLLAMTPTATES